MAPGRDLDAFGADPAHGVDQLLAGAVVERHREQHAGVAGGVGDGLADGPLHVLRRAGVGGVERPADPLDAHVQLVELLDPAEQLGVQPEDVADLGAGTDPVLGGEAEHGEPADVAAHGDAHEPGQVLLALGVPLGPGQAAPPGPAPVAVHDARDVEHGVVQERLGHSAGNGSAAVEHESAQQGRGSSVRRVAESTRWVRAAVGYWSRWARRSRTSMVVAGTRREWRQLSDAAWSDLAQALGAVVAEPAAPGSRSVRTRRATAGPTTSAHRAWSRRRTAAAP